MSNKNILLCLLSGVSGGLAFYNVWFSPFIFFFLFPLLSVISASSPRQAAVYGFISGAAFFMTALFWVGHVTFPGYLLLVVYCSLYWGIFAPAAVWLMKRPLAFLSLPFLWIILEFCREHVWTGFGWAGLGYSLYRHLLLIQPADLLGAKYLSWLIVLVNCTILAWFKKKRLPVRETAVVLSLLVLGGVYSSVRMHTLRQTGSVPLSLVQTNIPQQVKWARDYAPVIREKLLGLAGCTAYGSLVIYPEASYPFSVMRGSQELKRFFSGLDRDLLLGVIEEDQGRFYNSAVLLSPGTGRVAGYSKLKLIPWGEYVPLRKFLSFIEVLNDMADTSPGREKVFFSFKGKRFAVLICFEDLFPMLTAEFSRNADFLVNITNDAWFYGQPEAYQHLGIMVLRAVENRISIARCANTGISGLVSFKGEISSFSKGKEEIFVSGVYNTDLPVKGKGSFYSRFPEFFVYLGIVFLLFIMIKYNKMNIDNNRV